MSTMIVFKRDFIKFDIILYLHDMSRIFKQNSFIFGT